MSQNGMRPQHIGNGGAVPRLSMLQQNIVYPCNYGMLSNRLLLGLMSCRCAWLGDGTLPQRGSGSADQHVPMQCSAAPVTRPLEPVVS